MKRWVVVLLGVFGLLIAAGCSNKEAATYALKSGSGMKQTACQAFVNQNQSQMVLRYRHQVDKKIRDEYTFYKLKESLKTSGLFTTKIQSTLDLSYDSADDASSFKPSTYRANTTSADVFANYIGKITIKKDNLVLQGEPAFFDVNNLTVPQAKGKKPMPSVAQLEKEAKKNGAKKE